MVKWFSKRGEDRFFRKNSVVKTEYLNAKQSTWTPILHDIQKFIQNGSKTLM